MPGALASEAFGSGCAVPCDISKRSKCVKNYTTCRKLSMCHIYKTFAPGAATHFRVIFLNGPNAWKPRLNSKFLFWSSPTTLMKYLSINF